MLAMRRLWTVLAGASFGAILARTILDWLLGLEGTWVDVAIPVAAALGGYLSIGEARRIKPMDRRSDGTPSSAGERSPEASRPLRA